MRGILAGVVLSAMLAAPAAAHDVDIDVVSSRADQVSGGDALIRIDAKRSHDLTVRRNGVDVTGAFEREGRDLVGVVDGLRLGRNTISVYDRWRRVAKQRLRNHPIEGPIFSGPHQRPFVCKTNQPSVGLGEPLVDNQVGDGFRVLAPDGSTAGWSRNCTAAHAGRLALPLDGGRQPAAAAGRPAPGRPRLHHDDRRPHRAVHRPPRARHDQSLHLLARDARRPGRGRDRHVALEPPARLLLRRRRGDRPQPGRRPAARRSTPTCSAAAMPSPIRAGRARASTTTWSSAARRR